MLTRLSIPIPYAVIVAIVLFVARTAPARDLALVEVRSQAEEVQIITANYRIVVNPAGFRFAILRPDGKTIAAAHTTSGLRFGGQDAATAVMREGANGAEAPVVFDVTNTSGQTAVVEITPG